MDALIGYDNMKIDTDGYNTGVILSDNSQFSVTDYKVIRGQMNSGLVRCEKLKYNGCIKLLYFTEKYTPLQSLLPLIQEQQLLKVIADILKVYISIRENGFLECRKLLLSTEYIFVEESMMTVGMIYIPADIPVVYSDMQTYKLRSLVLHIVQTGHFGRIVADRLSGMIANEKYSFNEIYESILSNWKNTCELYGKDVTKQEDSGKRASILKLISVNAPVPVSFTINRRDFSIGREKGRVDGVVTGSTVVGRKHCCILYRDGRYYIEDCSSKNGTFLDGRRLTGGIREEIHENSAIRIANINFKVKFK